MDYIVLHGGSVISRDMSSKTIKVLNSRFGWGAMKRTKRWRTLLFSISLLGVYLVMLVVLEPHTHSANIDDQDKSKQELTFDKVVQPFFANHCYVCHNKERMTANLDLGVFTTAASLTNNRATLKRILEKLSAGQMPPPEMLPPKTGGDNSCYRMARASTRCDT